MARTAACFCVFLTLETATFLAAAALRATGFGAAFFGFAVALDFAAAFLAGRSFAADRTDDRAAAALVALGFEGDFAFTARFALFAGLAFDRDVDRLNPFVRLLLMGGFSKGCPLDMSSRKIGPQLTIDLPLNQRRQVFAGALRTENQASFPTQVSTKKNLDGHRWLC
jgi:4-amino-4-deoxy-L-arabinose transferase-like glycosyltransferase